MSNSVLLTASGWKSPELLTQGDVVYLDSAAGGGNDPVEVQEVTSRRSSQAEAAGVRNTVFVAAVLQQVRVRPTHAHAHTVKPVPSLQLPLPSPPPPLHVPASRMSPLHACPRFTHVPPQQTAPASSASVSVRTYGGGGSAGGAGSSSPRHARSPKRASVDSTDILPVDMTAEAIAALSRHSHHVHQSAMNPAGLHSMRVSKKAASMWAGTLKLGVTTPANVGRCVVWPGVMDCAVVRARVGHACVAICLLRVSACVCVCFVWVRLCVCLVRVCLLLYARLCVGLCKYLFVRACWCVLVCAHVFGERGYACCCWACCNWVFAAQTLH